MITQIKDRLHRLVNLKSRVSSIIGVDIGSSSVKVVGMKMGKAPSLSFYSIIELPEGCDENYITESIRKVLKDNIFSKDASLTFTNEAILFRRVELPHMPYAEILEALKWKEKDSIPFNIENAALEFDLLREYQKEDGSKFMELIFVAVPKDILDNKIEILKKADLNVISVSMPPFGLENIVKIDSGLEQSKTVMIVDVGFKKSELSIFKNKTLDFVRSIPLGSNNITEAMQVSLASERGEVKFSKDEAEEIKRRLGIAYEEAALEKGVSSTQIVSLMRPILEQFSKEIRRSIEYYSQEYGEIGSAMDIYLVGGGSKLKNLDKYLSEELNLSVKRMEIPKSIDTQGVDIKSEDAVPLISLVGVVLGYRDRLNLLPHKYKAEKIEFVEKISLRMTAIIAAILILVSFLFIKVRVDDYRNRLKSLPFQKDVMASIRDLRDRVLEREAFENKAEGPDINIEHIMKELSNIIPQNVVLDSFNIDRKGKMLGMRGVVYGPRNSAEGVLTKFMEELERSKYFKDAQLSSVQGSSGEKEEASSFEITSSLE